MTPTLHLDADALARQVVRRAVTEKPYRPVGYKIDTDGIGLSVLLPGPATLASLMSLPGVDAYRDGARLLVSPHGSDEEPEALSVLPLADSLREALSALGQRRDAGEAYADLRLAASTPSPRFSAYLLDVVRAYVRSLPKVPRVAGPKADRLPAKSGAERMREHRERAKVDAFATAVEWLETLLLDEDAATGWRSGDDLYADCLAYLDNNLLDPGAPLPSEPEEIRAACLSRREVYALLDGVLDPGSRRRTNRGAEFFIPAISPERRAEYLAEEADQ